MKNVSKLIAQMPDVALYAHEKGKNKVTLFHFTGHGSNKAMPKGELILEIPVTFFFGVEMC